MRWTFPFSLLQKSVSPRIENPTGSQAPSKSGWAVDFLKTILSSGLSWSTFVSENLKTWIDDFQPAVLYVTPGPNYTELTQKIANQYGLPVVIHMMDDWPASFARQGLLGPYLRWAALKHLRELVRQAHTRMAIGEEMCEEYKKRYGFEFKAYHNGIEITPQSGLSRPPKEDDSPFQIVYVGSILPEAQLESLVDASRVISNLASEGKRIQFRIYSPNADTYRTRLQMNSAVRAEAPVTGEEFHEKLRSADLLLLPVNFDEPSWRYVRYSLPVKLPYYLLSGTPILVYGPVEVGYITNAVDEKWGAVVARRDDKTLENAITDLMRNSALRRQLVERAAQVGLESFDIEKIRPGFQEALRNAAGNKWSYLSLA